jgi:molecular chaperone GrpE (heat shock protein)
MRIAGKLLFALTVLGVIIFLSNVSFAEGKHSEAFIKLLNDSSIALMQTNPTLSAGLTKFAKDEIAEKQEKEEKNEVKENKEPEAMAGVREAHIKLLKDSAAALQQTHPDLAAELTKYADRKEKKMEKAKTKQMNEKK